MRTVQTSRIDSSIEIYRNHIIVPRKLAISYTEENGASQTLVSYTATIFDDQDESRQDGSTQELSDFKTLEGTLRIARLKIDLSVEEYKEWVG